MTKQKSRRFRQFGEHVLRFEMSQRAKEVRYSSLFDISLFNHLRNGKKHQFSPIQINQYYFNRVKLLSFNKKGKKKQRKSIIKISFDELVSSAGHTHTPSCHNRI